MCLQQQQEGARVQISNSHLVIASYPQVLLCVRQTTETCCYTLELMLGQYNWLLHSCSQRAHSQRQSGGAHGRCLCQLHILHPPQLTAIATATNIHCHLVHSRCVAIIARLPSSHICYKELGEFDRLSFSLSNFNGNL